MFQEGFFIFPFWLLLLLLILWNYLCRQVYNFQKRQFYIFLSNMTHFIFLLIALYGTSSILSNRSSEKGHSYLTPNLSSTASGFSPLSVMLTVGFLSIFFSKMKKSSVFQVCWEFLIKHKYWVLSSTFFCAYTGMIIWFLFFT